MKCTFSISTAAIILLSAAPPAGKTWHYSPNIGILKKGPYPILVYQKAWCPGVCLETEQGSENSILLYMVTPFKKNIYITLTYNGAHVVAALNLHLRGSQNGILHAM